MLYELIVAVLAGFVFGMTLEKSKVMEASVIIGQFLFKRFIMLKVFLVAMIVSLVVLNGMHFLNLFAVKLKDLNFFSNILGGSLLGVGIAMSGACPGTVFAQMGVGYKDAFFTFAGGLVAAYLYLFFGNDMISLMAPWTLGKIQLTDVIRIRPDLLGVGIVIISIIFLIVIERKFPWKDEVEKIV